MRPPAEATAPRDDPFPRLPHPGRLDPGHPRYGEIVAAHEAALRAGRAGYQDPGTGLFVLTAGWLWERGTCCDQGCRHCPFVARPPGDLAGG
jgi:hypothetical protein